MSSLRVGCWFLALLLAGCAAPDRRQIFQPARPPGPPAGTEPGASVPEELRPHIAGTDLPLAPAPPGGPWTLSLEEAVIRTLRNNRDLQVRQLNPVITGAFVQLERGRFDPELFAEATYSRERASETSRATGEEFGVEASRTTVLAGVNQLLPSGTAVGVTAENDRSTSDRAPDQQVARLGLTVTQSLLQGFGPQVNLASVRQAELDTAASIYELRAFTEALLAEAEIAYWSYVLAVKELEIFERSLTVARQQRDEIEQQIEVGLLPEIEAAAARAEVARREQALITAQSVRQERQLRLLRLLGHDMAAPDPTIHAVSEPDAELRADTALAERLELARRSRPELEEARLRIEQHRLETVITRNGILPRLELFAALGRTGYAESMADSFRELDGDTYDFTAGVRFSHLLGNRSARARDLAARASRSQAELALANLRDLVLLDVRLAANNVERTRREIAASAETRKFQEETLFAERERFAVGANTALLVAQAQRDLLASQIAEAEAVISHRIALTKLYLAEGSLLARRGIALSGTDDRP